MLAHFSESSVSSSHTTNGSRRLMRLPRPRITSARLSEANECFTGVPFAKVHFNKSTLINSGCLPTSFYVQSPSIAPTFTFLQCYKNAEEFLDLKRLDIVEPEPPGMRKQLNFLQKQDSESSKLNMLSKPVDSSLMTRRKLGSVTGIQPMNLCMSLDLTDM